MAHRIEKPFRKANSAFKVPLPHSEPVLNLIQDLVFCTVRSRLPHKGELWLRFALKLLRFCAVLRWIVSFLKGFRKFTIFGIITFLLVSSFSSVDAGFINVSLGGGGATGDLPVPAELGLPFESTSDATKPIILVIREAIKYVGLLAILALSWWGIQFLTSMGNDEKVKGAKQTIIYALVGVLLSVVAYTIIDIVNSLRI